MVNRRCSRCVYWLRDDAVAKERGFSWGMGLCVNAKSHCANINTAEDHKCYQFERAKGRP